MTNGESVNSVKGDDYSHFIIMKKKSFKIMKKHPLKTLKNIRFMKKKNMNSLSSSRNGHRKIGDFNLVRTLSIERIIYNAKKQLSIE